MSRKKAGAHIAGWLSARHDCNEGRFIQIGNSLLLCREYQQLTAGAKNTYQCMSMESGGQREFVFPLSAAKKYGISKNTLSRHIDELTASGFITVRSGASLRQPNIYSFSFEWKTNNAAK